MSKERSDVAKADISRAKAFGRKPSSSAMEAAQRVSENSMTVAEALDVQRGAVFGRKADRGTMAEAQAVLKTAAESQPHLLAFDNLIVELTQLAESKLRMDPFQAGLHARSEGLAARQTAKTAEEAASNLRGRRDALKNAKTVTSV